MGGHGFGHPRVVALDRTVDRWAGSLRGHTAADRVMYTLSQLANHSMMWHGINVVDAVVGGPTHRRRAVRRSVLLVVEQALVNVVIKSAFDRNRPEHDLAHPHDLREPATSSFPSGHASAGACATVLLTRDLGYGPVWAGLGAVVGWSRIHVGAHHASDVVGGAVVGAALGTLAGRCWPPPDPVD